MPVPLSTLGALHGDLMLARDLIAVHGEAWLRSALGRGDLIRVRRGVFTHAETWHRGDADYRYRLRVHAVAATRPMAVFSGFSAAAVWELPVIGPWPSEVYVLSVNSGGRRSAGVVEQAYRGDPGTTIRGGLLLTSPARTVLEVARSADLRCAVTMADAALHVEQTDPSTPLCTLDEVRKQFAALSPFAGSRQCEWVLGFADGLSGSAGESLSRVVLYLLGFPAPILQQPFYDAKGLIGIVDFWWPQFKLIGEFDGKGKYLRAALLKGEATSQAIYREKVREDRLRALGLSVSRWDWDEALAGQPLAHKLVAAGLPQRSRPSR